MTRLSSLGLTAVSVLAFVPAGYGTRPAATPVMHARVVDQGGRLLQETWTEEASPTDRRSRTVSYDRTGHVTLQTVTRLKGTTLRIDTIDYLTRTWQTQTRAIPRGATNVELSDGQYFPAQLRRLILLHLIGPFGHRRIGGIETVLLQGQLGSEVLQVWVKPVSYLAVQVRTKPTGTAGPSIHSDPILFNWVTRAEAHLGLAAPRGFRHEQ
jgi:hypothetical protein